MLKLRLCRNAEFYGDNELGKFGYINPVFKPGITCIVGPNGSGKTTMLKQIEYKIREMPNYYKMITYDNLKQGASHKFSSYVNSGNFDAISSIISSSEGEGIFYHLLEFAIETGKIIRNTPINKEVIILLDGIDSGLSIDKIYKFKEEYCKTVIEDAKKKAIDVYIIAAANTYAMVDNSLGNPVDCIKANSGAHTHFKSYGAYRNFIIKESEKLYCNSDLK